MTPDVVFKGGTLIPLTDDKGVELPPVKNGIDVTDDSQAAVLSAIHDMVGYYVRLIRNAMGRLLLNKETETIVALIPAESSGIVTIDGFHISYEFQLAAKAAYYKK